jgi:selenide,water dikinase
MAQNNKKRGSNPNASALGFEATLWATVGKVRGNLVAEGAWVWRWKDWIDRRWMRKYNELPAMPATEPAVAAGVADDAALKEISAFAMRCGGCGAKVGSDALARALQGIGAICWRNIQCDLQQQDTR